MKTFLTKILVDASAVVISAYLLPGAHVDGFGYALIMAIVLAFLNQLVKPLLIIFTIPATILTLGLFLLVINALIIELADWLVSGFVVDGFWWALVFSLLLTLVKSLVNSLVREKKSKKREH